MNRCARNVSEIASAIEKCISYILSTYKYIISRVTKLISDTFLHGGGALEIHVFHLPLERIWSALLLRLYRKYTVRSIIPLVVVVRAISHQSTDKDCILIFRHSCRKDNAPH